jgi:hypothetical protein
VIVIKAPIQVIPAGTRTRAAATIPIMRVCLCNTDREYASRGQQCAGPKQAGSR